MKVRDVIRLLEQHGWQLRRIKGSHRQFRKAGHPNVVTVPGHPGEDLPVGTMKAVLRDAGIEPSPR